MSVRKCALHTPGVPVINYSDIYNVRIFKQQKLIDHLLNNCLTIFWGDFLEMPKQFSGRGSKMYCLLKKSVIRVNECNT